MPLFRSTRSLALILGLLATLTAASARAQPQVVASIAPLHALVAGVMQGVGTPQLLLRGGETPHSFSLRPSDARMLHGADVVFWIGAELERPLQHVLSALPDSRSVSMLEVPEVERLPSRGKHRHDHEPGHDHDAVGVTHAAIDPHIWLLPRNAIAMNDEIARVLSAVDPVNAPRYRSNATQQKARLVALDESLRAQLAGLDTSFAVFHDAYQYFEHAFGLQSAATVATHPERRPGAAHLHQLRRTLEKRQVRCLFSEPQFDARLVARLSDGLPVRHAVLDPLGANITPGPNAYVRLMQDLAATLTTCLREDAQR